MVLGFATLVENKDYNTGGHIRRTSAYAVMIGGKIIRESFGKLGNEAYETMAYEIAMPLESCLEIIRNGIGTAFDPDVVEAFFLDSERIFSIYKECRDEN